MNPEEVSRAAGILLSAFFFFFFLRGWARCDIDNCSLDTWEAHGPLSSFHFCAGRQKKEERSRRRTLDYSINSNIN